jgi:hypothetical protein
MDERFEHFSKHLFPIELIESDKIIFVRDEYRLKQKSGKKVIEFGISILKREVHPRKQLTPIEFTEFGRITFVRE